MITLVSLLQHYSGYNMLDLTKIIIIEHPFIWVNKIRLYFNHITMYLYLYEWRSSCSLILIRAYIYVKVACSITEIHEDVIEWKHFPRYWPFVRGIHRSPVNSPHKGQWHGASMFFLDLRLNKRLSKHLWGWWFETASCSLWRHGNEQAQFPKYRINNPHNIWPSIEFKTCVRACGVFTVAPMHLIILISDYSYFGIVGWIKYK